MILGWYAIRSPSEAFPRAKAAAEMAVRLAPGLGEAHSSLAAVSHLYNWDWEAAGRHFQRAVELNPRYAYGRVWHAFYLMTRGEREESLRQSHVANRLDPVNLSIKAMTGWLHFLAQSYAAAEEILEEALDLEESFGITNIFLAWLYEEQKRWQEAFTAWTRAEAAWRDPESGQPLPSLRLPRCHTLAVSGQKEEAARLFGELQSMEAAGAYLSPVQKAAVLRALGRREDAFAALDEASESRDCWLLSIHLDPRFSRDEEFRRDPRFGEILRRVGLPG
jgi:tetratricopeptide (TPR) repeat protein